MRRQDMEGLTREQLIAEAERLGVPRPRVLTQPELVDEIISRSTKNERERARARGWLGRARDLLARVVEKGLHLPDAARAIRSNDDRSWPAPPPPLPTVTLAEIYAAQGHLDRAVSVLDEVLAREPDHAEALLLRARFVEQAKARAMRRGAPPAPEEVAPADDEGDEDEDSTAPEGAGSEARTDVSDEDVKPAAAGDESATTSEAAEPIAITAAASDPAGADVSAGDTLLTDVSASETTATTVAASEASETTEATSDASETTEATSDAEAADPALPTRYDLDEIVAIAVDPRTIYLYWEVRATTLAHAQASAAEGALCVRVASVTASWDGPAVTVRDLRVDSLDGDRFIRDIQPGAHVRVSVGWLSGEVFEPFAVGIEVTAPHLAPSDEVATAVATWSPRPGAPVLPRRGDGHPSAVPTGGVHFGHQEPAAPFTGDASTAGPQAGAPMQAGALAPPFTGALFAGAPGRLGGREALVVSWNQQGWMVHPEGLVQEGRWFQPGGASELGREGPLYRLGGASELGRGGASELGRSLGA